MNSAVNFFTLYPWMSIYWGRWNDWLEYEQYFLHLVLVEDPLFRCQLLFGGENSISFNVLHKSWNVFHFYGHQVVRDPMTFFLNDGNFLRVCIYNISLKFMYSLTFPVLTVRAASWRNAPLLLSGRRTFLSEWLSRKPPGNDEIL